VPCNTAAALKVTRPKGEFFRHLNGENSINSLLQFYFEKEAEIINKYLKSIY